MHVLDDIGPALYAEGWDWGVRGKTNSPTGAGVQGEGLATGVRGDAAWVGAGNRIGGEFTASGGSNNIGVKGTSTIGVQGVGTAYGVYGETNSGLSTGVFGRANHTNAVTTGVLGEVASTSGTAVLGQATAATGSTIGVRGTTASSSGVGVRGEGPVTGVRGDANGTSGSGDRFGGHFTASGGSNNVGVYSFSTTGVQGVGTSYGVRGSASSAGGTGVSGAATATSGNSIGVSGQTSADSGVGVMGTANSPSGVTYGVQGQTGSPAGAGVYGRNTSPASNAVGVLGNVGFLTGVGADAAGVRGTVTDLLATGNGIGVEGVHSAGGIAVRGASASGVGVSGSSSLTGVRGEQLGAPAVLVSEASGVFGVGMTGVVGATAADNRGGVFGGNEYSGSGSPAGMVARNHFSPTGWGLLADDGSFATPGNGPSGVLGIDGRDHGAGVVGEHRASAGVAPGVEGFTNSSAAGAVAVLGRTTHSTGNNTIAVQGLSEPSADAGLGGDFRGGWVGVRSQSTVIGVGQRIGGLFVASGGAVGNTGVMSFASGVGAVAVYGLASQAGEFAGKFSGDVSVTGTLTKGGGSFKIDHPLDPENKYLYHSFVESHDMMNVYNGNTVLDGGGEAWVELPEWFESLNRDFRYQLTSIGAPGLVFVKREVSGNRFQVGGPPGLRVSWQVTGIRKDPFANAHRIPVEVEKPVEERGLYLHYEAYGAPRERSIDYVLHENPLEAKQAVLDEALVGQRTLWAEQAAAAQIAQRHAARWAALGLPPPATAVVMPDPDVYLREHPEYREQIAAQAERAKSKAPELRGDKR